MAPRLDSHEAPLLKCTAAVRVDKKLPVKMFDLVNLISSFMYTTAKTWSIYLAVYKSLHCHTYNKGTTAKIYGVFTLEVRNYSTLAPTTEFLQQRYVEYILWWFVFTPLSHLPTTKEIYQKIQSRI